MATPQSLPALAPVVAMITLLQLAAGTAVVALVIDILGKVGRGFRGTTAAICAALAGLALLVAATMPDPRALLGGGDAAALTTAIHWSVAFLVLLCIDTLMAALGTDAARHVVGALTAAAGAVALAVAASALIPAGGDLGAAEGAVLPGGLLCGGALAGMLLGHWYLIAPDLTFKPLRQAVYIVFGAVVVNGVAMTVGLIRASPVARSDVLGGGNALLFWLLVVGSGIVFTAAVNALTLYFARIRANQPATAMLYGLIISVLMGVVPASLVFLRTGVGI